MWFYQEVTRKQFEKIKDEVEAMIHSLGGKVVKIHPPYQAGSVSIGEDYSVENDSDRTVFQYGEEYFRVEEICFPHKPCIVIEYGNYEDLMNDTMIDAEPFPYDLSKEEIELEVKYSLGILPYPKH